MIDFIGDIHGHYDKLIQLLEKLGYQYEEYLDWFKTLPLFFETDRFRAVHACWDQPQIDFLKSKLDHNCLTDYLIYQSVEEGSALNEAVEITLKGKEIEMPDGMFFLDKDGTRRTDIRIKWWENPHQSTYKSLSVEHIADLPDHKISNIPYGPEDYYKPDHKPVFFGHYWLKHHPVLYRDNICCLDYSVARAGKLVAYRFDGEQKLDNGKLVFV